MTPTAPDGLLVLLSGGLDSSVLLRWLQDQGAGRLMPLFLEWGQRSIARERAAAEQVCQSAGLDLTRVDLMAWRAGFRPRVDMLDLPRNAIFLHAALPYAWADRCDRIALGATTEDDAVIDSNRGFVAAINTFWGGLRASNLRPQPRIIAPYLDDDGGWDKARIIRWADAHLGRGFVDATYSCWSDPACADAGRDSCAACIKRAEAMRTARLGPAAPA